MEVTDLKLTIAGKEFRVVYLLSDARRIEKHAAEAGRNLMAMLGGSFEEKLAVIWGGLRGNNNRFTKTMEDVEELLSEHQRSGGKWDQDVFWPCAEAALLSGLAGNVDERQVARIMAIVRQASGVDVEAEPGKAIRAAE